MVGDVVLKLTDRRGGLVLVRTGQLEVAWQDPEKKASDGHVLTTVGFQNGRSMSLRESPAEVYAAWAEAVQAVDAQQHRIAQARAQQFAEEIQRAYADGHAKAVAAAATEGERGS